MRPPAIHDAGMANNGSQDRWTGTRTVIPVPWLGMLITSKVAPMISASPWHGEETPHALSSCHLDVKTGTIIVDVESDDGIPECKGDGRVPCGSSMSPDVDQGLVENPVEYHLHVPGWPHWAVGIESRPAPRVLLELV